MRTRKTPLIPQFVNYALLLGVIAIALVVASVFEAYVSPVLMRSVIG